ncbi:MAG: DUF86 domain-containing protein [Clostridia bacterium]|nr:DUF86 domain-containing protein [Clostridia bacterium]
MEHEERNEIIRLKLLDEIADIEAFIARRSMADLVSDRMCQKAIVMSLINIGELSKAFTDGYLAGMPNIPWKAIRGFRNIAAHQYGRIDFEDVYKTVTEDIPVLKETLKSIDRFV